MEPVYYGAAAQYNKPSGFQFNPKILLIVGLVLLVGIGLMVASAVITGINAGPGRDLATLIAQETDMQTIVDKQRAVVQNGDLKKANAEFSVMLLSDSMTLTEQMTKVYGLSAIPKDIAAANTDTDATNTLKTAQSVGNFDTTYAALLRAKIAEMLVSAHRIHDVTGNATLKAQLQTTIKMLSGLDDQIVASKV
jgi:hypothetical protein